MNFNTILYRLGIDPSNFINEDNEPIKTEKGFIYEVRQRIDIRNCPYCQSKNVVVKDYDYVEINCSETDHIVDTLRIKKVRFKCKTCNKTFTPSITGIERYSRISNQSIEMIVKDFTKMITFKDISIRYGLTTSRILQIFDERIKYVPRKSMPFALCVDEIKFNEEYNQKYCCVLYDFNNRNIVDIVKNRQLGYLYEYFDDIKEDERKHVKYFISDMYDGYKNVRGKYFPWAIHVVDLFHVISQLTRAVNKIRVIAMKNTFKSSIEYRFMKAHWKYFLCRKENIPDKLYTSKLTGEVYHYDDMVFRCTLKNHDLLEAYTILQDLYHYALNYNYKEALEFMDFITDRLLLSSNEHLQEVGNTYRKWKPEIANGLARTQSGKHYTNGIAESINNNLKTIIKVSYGYHNFVRFRKRAMLIKTYKKDLV